MSSSTKSGVTTSYVYNALGQLIQKGANALYYYDGAGHVQGIYDGSGVLKEEIVWLGDTPIATLRPQTGGGLNIYNIHTDHLDTPRVITDSISAAVRWRWDGDPFGGGAVNDNPSGAGAFEFNLRFPGQMAMAETGLNYNYFRDYDPSTGRYVQSDPIGLEGGLNTYSYSGSSPIIESDPSGLDPKRGGGVPGSSGIPAISPGFIPGTPQNEELVCSAQEAVDNLIYNVTNTLTLGGVDRQREYEHAKRFCDTPPEPGRNDCATLSRQINHAQACVKLYQDWDAKWLPGRHAQKISEWSSRLNTLKMTHRINCTTKCCGTP
jgi:RHS repeat-associated protein